MGVSLFELSAEQMKFKAEVTEDKLKYRLHILDLSLPTGKSTAC